MGGRRGPSARTNFVPISGQVIIEPSMLISASEFTPGTLQAHCWQLGPTNKTRRNTEIVHIEFVL